MFAIATISLTLYMAFAIVGGDLNASYRLVAAFDDVSGLASGDLVKVAGTPVGRVGGVKVVDGRAVVDLNVDRNVRMPADSRAAIRWRDLIGQREVYLVPGTSGSLLQDGDRISRTQSAVDLGAVVNSIGPLTGSLDPNGINQILQSLATALSGNEGNINQITENLSTLLRVFGTRSGTLHEMIANYKTITDAVTARDRQIGQTVQNLQTLTQAFAANRGILDGAIVQLNGITGNLDAAIGGKGIQLGNLIDSVEKLMEITHGDIGQIDKLIKGLPAALQELLAAMDGGHFVRGTVVCIDLRQSDVCPFKATLPPAASGGGTKSSPFQKMLNLMLLGRQPEGT